LAVLSSAIKAFMAPNAPTINPFVRSGKSGGDIVPTDYKQIFVTPAGRLSLFRGTRVSPWVSFGGGFGHFSESTKLNYFGTNPGGSSTTGVIQAGLGLDVSPFQKGFSHFSFRGEVRDFHFLYS
jgi:hypothetical protein